MFKGTRWPGVTDGASTRESLKASSTLRATLEEAECSAKECELYSVCVGTRQEVSKQDKRRPRRFLG